MGVVATRHHMLCPLDAEGVDVWRVEKFEQGRMDQGEILCFFQDIIDTEILNLLPPRYLGIVAYLVTEGLIHVDRRLLH